MANEILNFTGYTIRVVGSGNLRATFYGFDKVESDVAVPLVMASPNPREPTRLAGFQSQRALVRFETTAQDEWFKVNNYTIWVKPLWSQFPE